MKYENFLKLYEEHKNILLFEDGIRPAKSVTRNILSSVEKFKEYFQRTHKTSLSKEEVAKEILKLTETGKSTIEDNIRNLVEIQFLVETTPRSGYYTFTKNFIDYVFSDLSLEKYIIAQIMRISSLSDITMLYNYILVTLREAVLTGTIVLYPDSYQKFIEIIPSKSERIEICKNVYSLYGFKSREHNPEEGDYTPNINYRIISTCTGLNLIQKEKKPDDRFIHYSLTESGEKLLRIIDENIAKEKQNEIVPLETTNTDIQYYEEVDKNSIIEDIYDELYLAESNNVKPDNIVNFIDLPQPLANKYQKGNKGYKRDPKIAANIKKRAKYLCEFDHDHLSFKTKTGNENYVEAHHLVPMQLQNRFFYNLDVEANIIALCPICHRCIHHATDVEKKVIITKLYIERITRLKECNIFIELNDLLGTYE